MTTLTLDPDTHDATSRPSRTLSADILTGPEVDAIRPDWLALFDRLDCPNWSFLPEAYEIWTSRLRPPETTPVIAVRDDYGRLRGVYPVMRDRVWRGPSMAPRFDYDPADGRLLSGRTHRLFPLRQIAGPVSLPATMAWAEPLCRPEDQAEVIDAIAGAILKMRGWDAIVLPVTEDDAVRFWTPAFAARGYATRLQHLGRVVQNIADLVPFDDLIAPQKRKFRQNVRRARKAGEEIGLTFRFVEGTEAVREMFELIAKIAGQSWKAQGRTGDPVNIPYGAKQRGFFERLFASDGMHGTPIVAIAEGPDGPAVVYMLLRTGDTVTALLTFWNGELERASPGLLLLGEAIDWALRNGARRFDMNTTAPWVRYLANEHIAVGNLIVFSRSPYGRLLSAVARARDRIGR